MINLSNNNGLLTIPVVLIYAAFFLLMFFGFSLNANSQFNELEIEPNVVSGIIEMNDSAQIEGVTQFKVENLDLEKAKLISADLKKYAGEVTGFGMSVLDSKIIVSYRFPFNPNYILSILDRMNVKAYYDLNGEKVFYSKDGNSFFIR